MSEERRRYVFVYNSRWRGGGCFRFTVERTPAEAKRLAMYLRCIGKEHNINGLLTRFCLREPYEAERDKDCEVININDTGK